MKQLPNLLTNMKKNCYYEYNIVVLVAGIAQW